MARSHTDSSKPDPDLVKFGRVLRRARLKAKLSQRALAELSGMSQGQVSVLEAGNREPGLLVVVHLARALHMTTAEFVKDLG
jgi:transcriptional regulator with XRE-family HTH domain